MPTPRKVIGNSEQMGRVFEAQKFKRIEATLGFLEGGRFKPHMSVRKVWTGLCSRGARVPQATNICLWATAKTYFFHISLSAGHPGFHA